MTTSGTVQTTTVKTQQIVDTAYRRCKLATGIITSEMQQIGKLQLFVLLSALTNKGNLVWTIDRPLLGIMPGAQKYTLPQGSLDLDTLLYRKPVAQSGGTGTSSAGGTAANAFDSDVDTVCTQTSTNGNIRYNFASSTTVQLVGVNSNGDKTWTLVFETSDDAITWTQVLAPGSADYTDDVFTWYDIFNARPATYFRCRVSGGGTLDVRELRFCPSFTETQLARINQDDWSALPDKTQPNDPAQYFVIRTSTAVDIYPWPLPGVGQQFNLLAGWSRLYIQDVGALYQELELPSRWLDSVMWELAWRVSLELPADVIKAVGFDGNYQSFLQQQSIKALKEALDEERDDSPIYFSPAIAVYTA